MDRTDKLLLHNGEVGTPAANSDKSYREEEVTLTAIYEENIPNPAGRLYSDEVALKTRGKPL